MTGHFPDYNQVRKRVKRTLKYGSRRASSVNLPLSDFVTDYFAKNSPFDYMAPETSCGISQRGFADPCSLLIAMVYLDRLRLRDKDYFESSDPTDLYLPALVLASKFLHDSDTPDRASNSEWAEAANISDSHLNNLEWEFVKKLDWDTFVSEAECSRYLTAAETWVARKTVKDIGFGTYNELSLLVAQIATSRWTSILQEFLAVLGVATLMYTASLASLLASSAGIQSLLVPSPSNQSDHSQFEFLNFVEEGEDKCDSGCEEIFAPYVGDDSYLPSSVFFPCKENSDDHHSVSMKFHPVPSCVSHDYDFFKIEPLHNSWNITNYFGHLSGFS